MWILFFGLAVIGVLVLVVHVSLEMNALDTMVSNLVEHIRSHYEYQ